MNELEAALETLRALPKPQRRAGALLVNATFQRAVELATEDLLEGDAIGAAAWLEALAGREPDRELVAGLTGRLYDWRGLRGVFLLRALDRHVESGLMQLVFQLAGAPWRGQAFDTLEGVALRRRGEPVRPSSIALQSVQPALWLCRALDFSEDLEAALQWRLDRTDVAARLRKVGRVRQPDEPVEGLLTDEALEFEVETLVEALTGEKPVLVVGPRGSGRLSRLRLAANALEDWLVLEAGAAEINAGMTYVGELEGRMAGLVRTLDGAKVLWIAPEFDAMLYAGVDPPEPRRRRAGSAARGDGQRHRPRCGDRRPSGLRAAGARAPGGPRRLRGPAHRADERGAHAGPRRPPRRP